MKIWLVAFTYISLFLNIGCFSTSSKENVDTNSKNNMEEQIEESLALKYAEPFKVIDQYFDKSLNVYTFTASPKANDDIVFEGNYDERESNEQKKILNDGYPNIKYSYQAGVYFESLFPNKELKHEAQASVYSKYDHTYGTLVPEWDEYLEDRKDGSTIRMNCYFFEVPDQPYHQTVVTLFGIMETLHEKYENNYSVYAGFWPKGFLEDKNLEDLTFGFEATKQEDADDLLSVMQYLAKVVFIKIVNGTLEGLDEEKLFELIKDFNKNGPTPMVEF
ncbi:hypothetical protein [Portibacter lacus]|uniref:Uncharacterized protein n=1 Tax=Portibacter lacus TaxID=1099794 RepID=A0AA37SLI6_9BACT|nr:hypothetical protein [Portibacter lacus]GLR16688.1 hypothetical protein GCM10007940_13030 [Portibacter lacus]